MSDVQLLFFDTFAHDNGTDLNLDLVNFNQEVYISEVRIIPLGARVRADFPGGDRLGATNPSEFVLDFFVNDLSKPGVSAFQKLGTINYDQKGKIQLEFETKTLTDGLVLRGWYSTVTLAVYGSLTRLHEPAPAAPVPASRGAVTPPPPPTAAPSTPPPPPPPPPLPQAASQAEAKSEATRAVPRTPPKSPPPDQRGPPPAPASPSPRKAVPDEPLHPLSPGDVEAISDDEIPETVEPAAVASPVSPAPPAAAGSPPPPSAAGATAASPAAAAARAVTQSPVHPGGTAAAAGAEAAGAPAAAAAAGPAPTSSPAAGAATAALRSPAPVLDPDDAGLEDIMSDEEPMDDVLEYPEEEEWEDVLRPFNPETFQLVPLTGLRPPWLTPYELAQLGDVTSEVTERLAQLVAAHGEQPGAGEPSEVWVEDMETIVPHLPAALGQLRLRGGDDPVPALLAWLDHGLDFESAVRQPQLPYKLRHLKVGVRLAAALLGCDAPLAGRLLQRGVLQQLLDLSEREQTAASVRLMIVTALSAAVRWQVGLQGFVGGEKSCYSRVLAQLTGKLPARLKAALISLLRKVHAHRTVSELCTAAGRLGAAELCTPRAADVDTAQDVVRAEAGLAQVCGLLRSANTLLGHSERALPVQLTMQAAPPAGRPLADLSLLLRWSGLPEALLVLLQTPACLASSRLVGAARHLLNELASSSECLLMLAVAAEAVAPLLRLLSQVTTLEDGGEEVHPLYQTGVWLLHCLQAVQLLGALQTAGQDTAKQVSALHALSCLSGGARGRAALVHVLSRGELAWPLVELLAASERGTATAEYCADLLLTVLRGADTLPCAGRLAERARADPELATRLGAAADWLSPLAEVAARPDRVAALCAVAREHVERAELQPPPLVTALRELAAAAVPPEPLPDAPPPVRELRYRYALTQLYSADGMELTLMVLRRVTEAYGQPAVNAPALAGQQGLTLCALLRPTVALLRQMLALAVEARGVEFQDLTPVAPLVDTYQLLWAVPAGGAAAAPAQKIQRDVVGALLAFTQPDVAVTSEAAVQQSAWTRMVSEVLEAAVRAPHTLLPCLGLLSELLPLPLPIQTARPLGEVEAAAALELRRLWAAHLLTTGQQVRSLAALLCQTSCAPLLQAARNLLVQLADLSSTAALLVTSALLEAVQNTLTSPPGGLPHALNLLAGLVTHPCVKAAVLSLLSAQQTYAPLLGRLLALLTGRPVGLAAAEHLQAQEWLVSALHALCDQEVNMGGGREREPGGEAAAGALPPAPLLAAITDSLMAHLASPEAGFGSLLLAVRTLVILTEHKRGVHRIKSGLAHHPGCLQSLISRLSAEFSRDNSDCMATVQATLDLVRLLAEPQSAAALTPPQLAAALRWTEQGEEAGELVDPPLRVLERKIQQEVCGEDEELDALRDGFAEVIRQLDGVEEVPDSVEPGEPPPEGRPPPSLTELYQQRPVWTGGEEDIPTYWLQQGIDEEMDNDDDLVSVNLLAVTRELLPGLDLATELSRLLRGRDAADVRPSIRGPSALLPGARDRGHFSLPARGRGFGRPVPRGDHFRSRPPNTSRPPSLHVDDFVALEKRGEHPTGPTGYNNVPRVPARGRGSNRSRARSRAAFDRARGGFSEFRGGRNRGGGGPSARGGGGGGGGGAAGGADAYRSSPARYRGDARHEDRFGGAAAGGGGGAGAGGGGGGGFRGGRRGGGGGNGPYGGRFDKRDRFGFGRERGGKHYRSSGR